MAIFLEAIFCHYRKENLDYSQPSIFSYFYSIIERTDRIVRELDASAKGRLDWVRVGIKKNRGAVDIFGKK